MSKRGRAIGGGADGGPGLRARLPVGPRGTAEAGPEALGVAPCRALCISVGAPAPTPDLRPICRAGRRGAMRALVRFLVLLVVWTSGSLSGGSSAVSSLLPPGAPHAPPAPLQCGPSVPRKRGRPRHNDAGLQAMADQGSDKRHTSLTVGDAADIERMRGGRGRRERGSSAGSVHLHGLERPRVGRPPNRRPGLDEVCCASLQFPGGYAWPCRQHLCVLLPWGGRMRVLSRGVLT